MRNAKFGQMRRKKHSKVFKKMFLSFLLILGLPILISMIIYAFVLRQFQLQSDQLSRSFLRIVQNDVDSGMNGLKKLTGDLFVNPNFQSMADCDIETLNQKSYLMYDLYNDMQKQILNEDMVEMEFAYFPKSQKVISTYGNMSSEMFYHLYFQGYERDQSDFYGVLEEHYANEVRIFPTNSGNKILLLLSMKVPAEDTSKGIIGIQVDMDSLRAKLVSETQSHHEQSILILSQDDIYIGRNGDDVLQIDDDLSYLKLTENQEYLKTFVSKSNQYRITTSPSETINWIYLLLSPNQLLHEHAAKILWVVVLGLILSIVSGFLASYYITHKNYHPLESVLSLFNNFNEDKKNSDLEQDQDEYQWLSQQIKEVMQENIASQNLLSVNFEHMKSYYMTQLLNGPVQEEQYNKYLEFNKKQLMVLILYNSNDVDRSDIENSDEDKILRRFIINNVFDELIKQEFDAETFEYGDRVISIIQDDDLSSNSEKIRNSLEQLQDFTCSNFNFDVIALMGSIQDSPKSIYISYRDALELEEYVQILNSKTLDITDVKDVASSYNYQVEEEEKIIRLIEYGESEQASNLIQEVFRRNVKNGLSANMYRCLIYELIGSILKGASQAGLEDASSDIIFPDSSLLKSSPKSVEQVILKDVSLVCERINKNREEFESQSQFSAEVEAYVLENFKNPDLNISIASMHFGKTPAYFSSLYKKETGRSLLDYINITRTNYAYQLLEEGMTVAEAGEASGFRDPGGFIRIFKKYKGITPGMVSKKS
jgi:AraC-like DNA-binding protein